MNRNYNLVKSLKKNIDYSLYLVTDDKFLKNKEKSCEHFINKIIEGVLGGVNLVQLRLKKADDIYFYNMAVKLKNRLLQHNIPLIINNRIDICLSIDADGVHLGKTDLPLNIARNILGEKKIIGATINFTDEKDIEIVINNNIDYIAHENTLYESKTKKIDTLHIEGIKQQINILHEKFKYLQEKGRISPSAVIPPIFLIGGINTINIKETMTSFYKTCSGIAAASCIIGENANPFLNALKLRFIIDIYKKNYNVAFINMYSNILNYIFNNIENNEKVVMKNIFGNKIENEDKNHINEIITNIYLKKNLNSIFINNHELKVIQLNKSIENNEKIKVYLYHSKCLYSDNRNPVIRNNLEYECLNKWIEKYKNENIKDKIFIFIGEEMFHLFKKHFQSNFFKSNFFFLITKNYEVNVDSLKKAKHEIEHASVKYMDNIINVIIKNDFFYDDQVSNFGLFLSYFLIIHEKIVPEFLSEILNESNNIDNNFLKIVGAINISIKLLRNKHTL